MPDMPSHPEAELTGRIAARLDALGGPAAGTGILLAVSGGADSCALLAAMVELNRARGGPWRLLAGHLDHGLRGGSEADARFVEALARRLGVPAVVERRPVRVAPGAGGLENAARRQRYRFLLDLARREGCGYVATAHTADDQAETVLFRLLRGTGVHGLAAMRPQRPLDGPRGPELIRPMLEVRRHCVEAFCRGRGLSWREDPTNADVSITRNWIRHGLIGPLRERFGEDLIERLCTLAAEAAELDGLLAARGQALLEGARTPPPAFPRCPRWQAAVPGSWLKTAALAACDEATLQAAMRIELQRLGRPLGAMGRAHYRRLSELIRRGGSEDEGLSLPGGTSARVHAGRLWVVATEELPLSLAERPDSPSVPLKVPGTHPLGGGLELRCRFVDLDGPLRARILRGRERQAFYLDADRLEGPLRLRRISPGDRMRPLGSPGGKLLSDLLAGRGVEPVLRGETRCVCDEAGIVCALPVEIADRVRIGPDSLRAVVLHIQ